MKKNTIGIACATIKRLNERPYYFDHKCFWVWDILLENQPLFTFDRLYSAYMGDTETEANKAYDTFLKRFNEIGIYNNNKVAVIYDNDGIVAIGRSCQDTWIHIRDKFTVKTFRELELSFESLVVACSY